MPYFKFVEDRVSITRSADDVAAQTLATSIEKLQMSQVSDVIIHCKHGEKLRTNKLVLAVGSNFMRSMFAGSQACCNETSDLILADFSIESVIKVVNFMHTGKTFINTGDKTVQNEIRNLIEILEIGVDLLSPETNASTITDLDKPDNKIRTETVITTSKTPSRTTNGSLQNMSGDKTPASETSKTIPTPMTTTTTPTLMATATNSRQQSQKQSGQFSCQFCQKSFDDFSDLSKHVQQHFREPETRSRAEERPQTNPRVKLEPEDDSLPQILSVQSLQQTDESSISDVSSTSIPALQVATKAKSSLVDPLEGPHEKKPKLVPTARPRVKLNSDGSTDADESQDMESSIDAVTEANDDRKPKVKCCMCKLSISNISIQIERHLAISHFAKVLADEFGHSKVDCPRCGKYLKTRRGFLTHVFSQHSKLPKTFPTIKLALANKEIDMSGVPSKAGRKSKQWKMEAAAASDKMACPYCPQTTTNYHAMVSHVCHAHFDEVNHLLMPNTIEKSTCGICKRQFGTSGALTYHLATSHHLLDKILKSSGHRRAPERDLRRKGFRKNKLRYFCPECPIQVDSYFALVVHLGHIHFKDVVLSHSKPDHTCKFCNRSFSNLGPLAYHLTAAHQILKDKIPHKDQLIKPREKQEERE